MGPRGQADSMVVSGVALLRAALVEPVAVAVHFEDVDVVGQPIGPDTSIPKAPKRAITVVFISNLSLAVRQRPGHPAHHAGPNRPKMA